MDCCCWAVGYFAIAILAYLLIRKYLDKLSLADLKTRPVFITGCDSGFGRLLTIQLAQNGVPVFAGCLTDKGAEDLLKETRFLPGKVEAVPLDVTKQESVEKAFDVVSSKLNDKGLWAIVNNAGALGNNGPIDWVTVDDYKAIMELNAFGVIRVTQTFLSLVKKTKGRVVTVASIAGRLPFTWSGPYCVSKYACEGYMDVLRQEMRPFGVSVHTLEPGFFRNTGLLDTDALRAKQQFLWDRLPETVRQEYGIAFFQKYRTVYLDMVKNFGNSNPQLVSDAYFHAVTARFPHIRYHVGPDARFFFIPLSMLPTRVADTVGMLLGRLHGVRKPAAVQK